MTSTGCRTAVELLSQSNAFVSSRYSSDSCLSFKALRSSPPACTSSTLTRSNGVPPILIAVMQADNPPDSPHVLGCRQRRQSLNTANPCNQFRKDGKLLQTSEEHDEHVKLQTPLTTLKCDKNQRPITSIIIVIFSIITSSFEQQCYQ